MIRSRSLIACLVAVLLVLAQHAAFAHLLGHAGVATQTRAQPDQDSGHDAVSTLSHQCTTCLAFAALASPAPLMVSPTIPPLAMVAELPPQLLQSLPPQRPLLAYLSRAPPA
jgi:hypothetical protein